MRGFNECTPGEGMERISALVARLTLMASVEDGPMGALVALVNAISAGDTLLALRRYHALSRELLSVGARRVSGDLFTDYLIYAVLERENPFSAMAAAGESNGAVCQAARLDLAILGELATLGDAHLKRMIHERHKEMLLKPQHARDSIALMSSAVWTGSQARMQKAEEVERAPLAGANALLSEDGWLSWHYEPLAPDGSFAADEALEEVYARLMRSADWRSQLDDIWSFFSAYGSGPFIRHRAFRLEDGRLHPIGHTREPLCPVSFYDAQRTALMEHTIAFMRGEAQGAMLLSGGAGTGKTAMAMELLNELPEVRLVLAQGQDERSLLASIELMARQPLRFVLLLDDLNFDFLNTRRTIAALSAIPIPGNVLLLGTSRSRGGEALFRETLLFPYPQLGDFVQLTAEIIGGEPDRGWLRSACIDRQVDDRDQLTMGAALSIAARYPATFG